MWKSLPIFKLLQKLLELWKTVARVVFTENNCIFSVSCVVCDGCYATFELKRCAYMCIMKSTSGIGFSLRDNTSLPNSRFGAHFTNFLSDVEILQANSTVNAKRLDWHDHDRLTVYFTLPSRLQALGRHKLHQPRPPQSKFLSVIRDTKKFKRKLLSVWWSKHQQPT